jgi:hypothetical protein
MSSAADKPCGLHLAGHRSSVPGGESSTAEATDGGTNAAASPSHPDVPIATVWPLELMPGAS